MLFHVYTLVLVGFVSSASVKSGQAEEESRSGSDQLVRAGRHGPLQVVPQAWYENAIAAVGFRLVLYFCVYWFDLTCNWNPQHFIRNMGEWLSGQFVAWMQSRDDFFETIPVALQSGFSHNKITQFKPYLTIQSFFTLTVEVSCV